MCRDDEEKVGLCDRKLRSQHPAPGLTFAHGMDRLKHGQHSDLKQREKTYKLLREGKID